MHPSKVTLSQLSVPPFIDRYNAPPFPPEVEQLVKLTSMMEMEGVAELDVSITDPFPDCRVMFSNDVELKLTEPFSTEKSECVRVTEEGCEYTTISFNVRHPVLEMETSEQSF